MYGDIKRFLETEKIPKFRFKQLENAIFQNFILDFDEIETFPKALREKLTENFQIVGLKQKKIEKTGNTVKFLLKTKEGYPVEAVLILSNDGNRQTICVSSQVFCPLACTFCYRSQSIQKKPNNGRNH